MCRHGKWVVRVGYGSGLSSGQVTFKSTIFGPGFNSVRMKFAFGSLSGQRCWDRVGFVLDFDSSPVRIRYGFNSNSG